MQTVGKMKYSFDKRCLVFLYDISNAVLASFRYVISDLKEIELQNLHCKSINPQSKPLKVLGMELVHI